ncbi:2Fe-2S iron-sulfur cluster-binding protein [Azospirillum himalayense]|uniref:2Fe-2S iron-sulfur cluster-binding protein n=1 Tax=Azospirillum himalayense TaxID=654847 RepID=A0ABW0GAU9_9PROT
MPIARFVMPDGTERAVDVPDGWSLMEGARRDGIPGIVAECGGGATCATCHVIVDPTWFAVVGEPPDTESMLLELASERGETSRLSCQILMTDALDGITVRVPESQL